MSSVIFTMQHGSCTNYSHATDVGLLLVFPISFVVHATCVPSSKVFAKVPELVHVFITLKVRNYNGCY